MNLDEKPQFMKLLSTLFGAHGKPLSESMINGYWKGLQKMSLTAFESVCDRAIDRLQYAERGVAKTPTVAELWEMKRCNLREAPVRVEPTEPEWKGDAWDTAGNLALLAYLDRKKKAGEMDRYAPDSPYDSGKRCVVVGELTKVRAAILTKWKNCWARDMREDRNIYDGKLDGKKAFFDCMSAAEKEIDASFEQQQLEVA